MTPLKAWRKRMAYTQRQAARELGVTLATYQNWEYEKIWHEGQRKRSDTLARLAAAALENNLPPVT